MRDPDLDGIGTVAMFGNIVVDVDLLAGHVFKSSGGRQAPDGCNRRHAAVAVQVLDALPEEYRLPVSLSYCEKMSVAEVAAILSLNEEIAGQRVSRGMEMMLDGLSQLGVCISQAGLARVLSTAQAVRAPARLVNQISRLVREI